MLEHGGRLIAAAQTYGIPPADWLDLSTGINPQGWPVPGLPLDVWRQLPEDEDGLLPAAVAYYGAAGLIATAGSQQAIQALPYLRPPGRVGLLTPTYAEHGRAWQRAGHAIVELDGGMLTDDVGSDVDVVVLVNPNNPTGRLFPAATLMSWHVALAARGGWLVVDEAFVDVAPEHSLAGQAGLPGLVILRSLGKFFGLAGIRAGFVLAWPGLMQSLQTALGPWPLANPSRWAAREALQDRAWQQRARFQLKQSSTRLAALLGRHGLQPAGGTALFQYVPAAGAAKIHAQFARQGVLVRLFTAPAALRFGLPGTEPEWVRLAAALSQLELKPN
ncbi:MAG TPA: threonine-phosphate decarboxylase CobD [Novimethylophilus sp.]|jgi:L-threonine-O-3-phosphate decarboxylase|uniref:threonine-phosphate decarboxylase CobD n=1 Tax=Novimethylophilus sp. TaxID=2137426 RepID=UPI002F3F9875